VAGLGRIYFCGEEQFATDFADNTDLKTLFVLFD
jgi:hypothetical protein